MGVEGKRDQNYNPNKPTKMDITIQFIGDRIGGPVVILLNLAMRVGAPIAMFFEHMRGSRENNIEESGDKEEKGKIEKI